MTAEQLEELLAMLDNGHTLDPGRAMDELFALAPSLARRVLAAEKLAAEVERVSFSDNGISLFSALAAYREASK